MNIFMSIIWVLIALLSILVTQIYTQYSYQHQSFYSKALPQTKCTQIDNSQLYKLCIHCLSTKPIQNDHISTSNFQITSTMTDDNEINLPYKTFALKTLNIGKQNDLFCEEYLQFVDVNGFKKDNNMGLESGENVKKMLKLIQADLYNVTDVDRKSGNQIFQITSKNAQKHVIYQIISHPSSRNPQLVAKYFSRTSLNKVLDPTLNITLLLFVATCCVTYYIDSQKSQKIPNYTSIVLSSILLYTFLYLHIKLGFDSIFFESLSWAIFTWICLTKLDNIDDDQYKSSFITKVILSYLSGFSLNLTHSTGNNLYLGGFYLIFSIYLLFFRIISRSKANSPFRVQIINTLVYICLTLAFLIESLIVRHFYSFRFIKQIQIFRYGVLFFTPVVMLLIIYSENQIKVQNFQEYMEVEGSHMSIEENQLEEVNK